MRIPAPAASRFFLPTGAFFFSSAMTPLKYLRQFLVQTIASSLQDRWNWPPLFLVSLKTSAIPPQ